MLTFSFARTTPFLCILKGEDVVRVLNNIVAKRGQPMTIKTNNCSEIISKLIDKWNYERGIALDFSRLGKPTDNAMVERFNGRLSKNVRTNIDLSACKMPVIKLRLDDASITRRDRAVHKTGQDQKSLL